MKCMPKKRKPQELKPLKTLRIFCEGECTEPNYLNGYIKTLSDQNRKTVVKIQKTRKNTAIQLVDAAILSKKSSAYFADDEFWVVYDRESVGKYSDKLHDAARVKASKAGINIALCNVCFEYWILIHFVDTDAPFSSYDDLIGTSALRAQIKARFGCDYEKSARSIFELLKPHLSDARARAKRLNAKGLGSGLIDRARR